MAGIPISLEDVIGGRYQLEAVLGHGGMAMVYKARHTGTGKASALKIVHPNLASRPELVDMFLREARVAGRMGDHPNVVNVFDSGVDEQKRVPFMAMELLEGQTLEEHLQAQTPIARPLVRNLIEQLADALEHAHQAGVIHRDLKPGNLFLTKDRKGQPVLKIMDFGIAKVLEKSAEGSVTRIGSPLYAAPEQQVGDVFRRIAENQGISIARDISPATDVWAIGLIAYEMLTGLPKTQIWGTFGTLDDLMMRIVLEPTPVPSARAGERASLLPRGFDTWFARCLMKNAAHRWQSAREAAGALLQLLDSAEVIHPATQTQVIPPNLRSPPSASHDEPSIGQGSPAPRASQPSFHDENIMQGGTLRMSRPAIHRPSQPSLPTEATAWPSTVNPAKQTIPQRPLAAAMIPANHTPLPVHQWPETRPSVASPNVQPRASAPSYSSEGQDPARIASSTGVPLARTLSRPRQGYQRGIIFGAIGMGAGAIMIISAAILVGRRWSSEDTAKSSSTVPDTASAPAASPSGTNEPQQGTAALPDDLPQAKDGIAADTTDDPTASLSATPTATGGAGRPQGAASPPSKENPASKQGSVYIVSKGTRGECTVIINGKRLGRTPLAKRVEPGKLSIRCVLDAGIGKDKTIEVQAGRHVNVSFVW